MCGIVGYVGHQSARDVVVDALRRMEYRGYDSAGIALVDGTGKLTVRRRAGRLSNLESALAYTDNRDSSRSRSNIACSAASRSFDDLPRRPRYFAKY